MTTEQRIGNAQIAVRRSHYQVQIAFHWPRAQYEERYGYNALDGISAHRIERAVRALVEDGVITTPEMLLALGFTLSVLVEAPT